MDSPPWATRRGARSSSTSPRAPLGRRARRRLPVSRPAVSQHLKVLKEADLVIGSRRRQPADLPAQPGRPGGPAGLPRPLLEPALLALQGRRRAESKGEAMTTQTADTAVQTSIVVDAPQRAGVRRVHQGHGRLVAARPPHPRGRARRDGLRARARAAASTTSASTAASASGPACSPSSPPSGVVISWDITPQWKLETDPTRTSEVEFRFIPEGAGAHPGRARAPAPRPPRRGLAGRCATRSARPMAGRAACSASPSTSGTWRDRALTGLRRRRREQPHVEEHGEDVGSLPCSTMRPSRTRTWWMPRMRMVLPVGATPRNGPRWVPEPSSRNETMSPSSIIATELDARVREPSRARSAA